MTILTNQTDLDTIIDAIQDLVGAVTGIRAAPDEPPDDISAYPTSICFPAKGRYNMANKVDVRDSLHDIVIELHFERVDVARTIKKVKPYIRLLPDSIVANQTIADLCEGFDRIDYELLPMKYGTYETFGVRFTIVNLKLYPYGVKDNPIF